jgi:16S rRNA (uracil1498-N3)-methyltransferase
VTAPESGAASMRTDWAAAQDAAAHTFVVALDDTVEVTGPDGHHLQRVRRLRAGEHVTAADGDGNWRAYEISAVEPGCLRLVATGERVREPVLAPEVALAVALTKAGALDTVVAKCTELGVARITPVRAARCVVQWDEAQAERAVTRLRTVAREAAGQSRRARLPVIGAVVALSAFVGRDGVVIADRAGSPPADLVTPACGTWTVVVGPEGGFDPAEIEAFGDAPRVTLGPHVLRAETAPIAAVARFMDRARETFHK